MANLEITLFSVQVCFVFHIILGVCRDYIIWNIPTDLHFESDVEACDYIAMWIYGCLLTFTIVFIFFFLYFQIYYHHLRNLLFLKPQ